MRRIIFLFIAAFVLATLMGCPQNVSLEQARETLAGNFDALDANDDGVLTWGEAQAGLAALTAALFDQIDVNGDGVLSPAELASPDEGASPGEGEAETVNPLCAVTPGATHLLFEPEGGARQVFLSTAADCAWTVVPGAAWVTVEGAAAGQGLSKISLRASANTGPARAAHVTVNDADILVEQAQNCSFDVSLETIAFDAAGGIVTGAIGAEPGCEWDVLEYVDWITPLTPVSGTGPATVQLKAAPNDGPAREATVEIAGERFTLTQAEGCSIALDRYTVSLGENGGLFRVKVINDAQCEWDVSEAGAWLTTLSSKANSGEGWVDFFASANTGAERETQVEIGGQTLRITQYGACEVSLFPMGHSFDDMSNGGHFTVTLTGPCAWDATTRDEWITIESVEEQGNGGVVRYSVAPNVGEHRRGSIWVRDKEYTIDQLGPCLVTLPQKRHDFQPEGGTQTFYVVMDPMCYFEVTPLNDWIEIVQNESSGDVTEITYTVPLNTGTYREGGIQVGDAYYAVTQQGTCATLLSPTNCTVPIEGGQNSFTVTILDDCEWYATTNTSWISLISVEKWDGGGKIDFTVPVNWGGPREGIIKVGNAQFFVTQDGVCKFQVTPDVFSINRNGGIITIQVIASGGCDWTSAIQSNWIFQQDSSNSNHATFLVLHNYGLARSCYITVADTSVLIMQDSFDTPPSETPNTGLIVTHSIDYPGFYVNGMQLDIRVRIESQLNVTALCITEHLPYGWSFNDIISGAAPPLLPSRGSGNTLEMVYIFIPEFPIEFVYRVDTGEDWRGNGYQCVSGEAVYFLDEGAIDSPTHNLYIPEGTQYLFDLEPGEGCPLPEDFATIIGLCWNVLDLDHDNTISTLDAYLAYPDMDAIDALFLAVDTNDDSFITWEEALLANGLLAPMLALIDPNGDRMLTYKEVDAYLTLAQFCTIHKNGNRLIDCGDL